MDIPQQHQVRFSTDEPWHRRQHGNGNDHTACGIKIFICYSRDWVLDENLCPACFTKPERDTGAMKKIEREALEKADVDSFGEDSEADFTPVEGTEPVLKPKGGGER